MHWKAGSIGGLTVGAAAMVGSLATQYLEVRYGIPQEQSAVVLSGLAGMAIGAGRGLYVFLRSDDPLSVRLGELEKQLAGPGGDRTAFRAQVTRRLAELRAQGKLKGPAA